MKFTIEMCENLRLKYLKLQDLIRKKYCIYIFNIKHKTLKNYYNDPKNDLFYSKC